MRLKELSIKNFRGFHEAKITFPSSSNTAIFVGINGSGKSSILDCIAILLSEFISDLTEKTVYGTNFPLTDNDINESSGRRKEYCSVTAEATAGSSENIAWSVSAHKKHDILFTSQLHRQLQLTEKSTSFNFPILVYYQTNRAALKIKSPKKIQPKRKKIPYQLLCYESAFTKNITDLSDFLKWFRLEEDLENEIKIKKKDFNAVNKKLEVVRNALIKFLNQFTSLEFSNLHIEREAEEEDFSFQTLEKSSLVIEKNHRKLKIEQLSDGEQIILLTVSDIARRLAIANPGLADPLSGIGIVLIDEIELHLHPQWQREIIQALLHTFPNIQFILTTHSPHVLSHVEKDDVFIIDDFRIMEHTPYTKGRDSNSILFELFGVEERPLVFKEKLNELYCMIDKEKIEEAETALEEIKSIFGENDTEVVRIKTNIDFVKEEISERE
ncbi:MAG: AAA family ATPase [Desulfobacteraceae bacterium]|nr:AAA family ATPase [Desulfobacteraceae bacterium]